jgi:hypothetical protein
LTGHKNSEETTNIALRISQFLTMNGPSTSYEQLPALCSVLSFGSETLVPDNHICRLSYYLKCCILGCGIGLQINPQLLDYVHAHLLPTQLQQSIIEVAFRHLNLALLMNRAFILDEEHLLLPPGSMNTFLEFKTASRIFAITNLTVIEDKYVRTHKVMLCASKWLKDYFLDPFFRCHNENPLLSGPDLHFQRNVLISAYVSIKEVENALEPTVSCACGYSPSDASRCRCLSCESVDPYELTRDNELVITDESSDPENIPMVFALPVNHRMVETNDVVVATATII